MREKILRLALLLCCWPGVALPQDYEPDLLSTYSIIARDPASGELGMGVQSKAFAAGNRVANAQGGVAVIVHQAVSNPMYGIIGLGLLQAGLLPQQALDMMVRGDEGRDRRQVAILDMQGRSAAWTGPASPNWKGHKCKMNYCAQGNTLTGPEVVDAMVRSFESSQGPLAERLLEALDAAQAAGGDARGVQSAALMIAKPLAGAAGFSDRAIDIRVDDHRQPLLELRRLLNIARSNEMVAQANQKLQARDFDGALEQAVAARDRSPANDVAWVALGNVYVKMGRNADALAALKRAIELNPANQRQLPRNPNFEALFKQ